MAPLRQYFDTDFGNAVRLNVSFRLGEDTHPGIVLYDLVGYSVFIACYVDGKSRGYDYFLGFLKSLQYGHSKFDSTGKITLPSAKTFPGALRLDSTEPLGLRYQLFGDYTWRSPSEIPASRRVFIYSESALSPADVTMLQEAADGLGHKLQFRSNEYLESRARWERPLAFIGHDFRDKEAIARRIAVALERFLCPVWYDEFSLKVGQNLRDSIEKGLKGCKKCVLVLSNNFFSNAGWTKKEFDSIFTREILEQSSLVLPVWHGVTKEQVYGYCPSLLNVKGLDWEALGEDEVCRQLYRAITE